MVTTSSTKINQTKKKLNLDPTLVNKNLLNKGGVSVGNRDVFGNITPQSGGTQYNPDGSKIVFGSKGGTSYPSTTTATTNKVSSNTGQTVTFNKTGVTVTRGGITSNFDKAEWENILKAQAGSKSGDYTLSDRAKAFVEAGKQTDISLGIGKKGGENLTPQEEAFINEQAGAEVPNLNPDTASFRTVIDGVEWNLNTTEQPQQKQLPTIQQLQTDVEGETMSEDQRLSQEIISDVNSQNAIQKLMPRSFRVNMRTAGVSIREATSLSTLVQVWDMVKTAFTRKKPLKYEIAKDGFDARMKIIQTNIDAVNLGVPYDDADEDLKDAVRDFHRIEEASKGIGKINSNWLIDDGVSIDAEIALKLEELETLRTKIDIAIQKSKINKIKKRYAMGG